MKDINNPTSITTKAAGEDEWLYGYHVVGFFDLVAQKDHFNSVKSIPLYNAKREEILKTMRNTISVIRSLRSHFREIFKQLSDRKLSFSVPKEIEEHFTQMRTQSKLHILNISDSVIAWTPVTIKKEMDYPQALNSIWAILLTISSALPTFLGAGHPIRGGLELDCGTTIEPNSNEIYGPALNAAYLLECKEAKYPRVIIGKKLLDFLDHVEKTQFEDEFISNYSKSIIHLCRQFISVDEDENSIVHYLGPGMQEFVRGMPEIDYNKAVLLPAKEIITKNLEKFKDDEKLFGYYQRLNNYFEKYIKNWI